MERLAVRWHAPQEDFYWKGGRRQIGRGRPPPPPFYRRRVATRTWPSPLPITTSSADSRRSNTPSAVSDRSGEASHLSSVDPSPVWPCSAQPHTSLGGKSRRDFFFLRDSAHKEPPYPQTYSGNPQPRTTPQQPTTTHTWCHRPARPARGATLVPAPHSALRLATGCGWDGRRSASPSPPPTSALPCRPVPIQTGVPAKSTRFDRW